MSTPLILIAAGLIGVILVLLFRVQVLVSVMSGSDKKPGLSNKVNGALLLIVMILGSLWYVYYTLTGDYSLPVSASIHGVETDSLFVITIAIISVAFLITNFLLMFFAWRYQYKEGNQAKFFPDNHKLELVWTLVPALVLTYLVLQGQNVWSTIMYPTKEMEADKVELEIVGSQFKWEVRYPGQDGQLGSHKFEALSSGNTFGINLADERGYDDFQVTEMVLPVNKPIHFKIRAKDVIHSVYAPHFRVKMDAVPGMPTEFWFTPTMTSEEMKEEVKSIKRYSDLDAEGAPKYENFTYEIACTEICGRGHNSMRFLVRVVSQEEYDKWYAEQSKVAAYAVLAEDYIRENIPAIYKSNFEKVLAGLKGEEAKEKKVEEVVSDSSDVSADSVDVVEPSEPSVEEDSVKAEY